MTRLREIMPIIHAEAIELHSLCRTTRQYVSSDWAYDDFEKLVDEHGDEEVVHVQFLNTPVPEIYLKNVVTKEKTATLQDIQRLEKSRKACFEACRKQYFERRHQERIWDQEEEERKKGKERVE